MMKFNICYFAGYSDSNSLQWFQSWLVQHGFSFQLLVEFACVVKAIAGVFLGVL